MKQNTFFSLASYLALTTFLIISQPARAVDVVKGDQYSLSIWGRGQMLGIGELVPQDIRPHDRVYLYLEQARVGFQGLVDGYHYYTELSLGGEDITTSSGIAMTLLEMRFDVPLIQSSFLRIGEYKVPFGREYLSEDGSLLFAHRSIENLGFYLGRDVGLAIGRKEGAFSGALGVFTAGSRDIPERYLPEDLGIPLMVLRIGYDETPETAFSDTQAGNFHVDHTEFASYFNIAYMKDTLIGHSTVLGLRPTDKNLLINPNWNPYLGRTPYVKTQLLEGSIDGVIRKPAGDYVLSGEAELDAGMATNDYGMVRLYGGRLQGSAAKAPWEFALRYAMLVPDQGFAAGGANTYSAGYGPVAITPSATPIHEVSTSITYYLKPWSKLIFQPGVLIHVPVIHEAGIGSYVSTEQPDQTTETIKADPTNSKKSIVSGSIDRETVPEVQLMWQIGF